MTVSLTPDMQQMIEARVRSGQYATPEEVIHAGLRSLAQLDDLADFAPGELDALLDEAEESIRRDGLIPAHEVFAEIAQLSQERRGQSA